MHYYAQNHPYWMYLPDLEASKTPSFTTKCRFGKLRMERFCGHIAARSDENHSLGGVTTLFIIAYEPAPSGHPNERAFDDPTASHDFDASLIV